MATGNPKSSKLPSSGEIWYIERPLIPGSHDPHYGLVTAFANGVVYFYFITTDGDAEDFRIDDEYGNFMDTGLKHTSHVRRYLNYEVKIERFHARLRGRLTGELKKAVEDWYGDRLG